MQRIIIVSWKLTLDLMGGGTRLEAPELDKAKPGSDVWNERKSLAAMLLRHSPKSIVESGADLELMAKVIRKSAHGVLTAKHGVEELQSVMEQLVEEGFAKEEKGHFYPTRKLIARFAGEGIQFIHNEDSGYWRPIRKDGKITGWASFTPFENIGMGKR